jgi:starvation-inducible DNA-binding protein
MSSKPATHTAHRVPSSQPWLHQHGTEIQEFGTVRHFPLGLSRDARLYSCQRLNKILADTQILYTLYKKHHWLMRGATFYQLHLLLDKHAEAQNELIDKIAERVQTLGGVAVGDPRHVAEITRIPRAPNGCEEVPAMLSRLLEAHELILIDAHDAGREGRGTRRRRHQRPDRLRRHPHRGNAILVPGGAPGRYAAGPRLAGAGLPAQ